MKLYAKVASERATKGQGGNSYVRVDFTVGGSKYPLWVADVRFVNMGKWWEIRYRDNKSVEGKVLLSGDMPLPTIQTEPKAKCECPSMDCPLHPVEYPLDGVPVAKAKKQKTA